MKNIQEPDFRTEVLGYSGKVLVNFYADWNWCAESNTQGSLLESLAGKLEDVEGLKFVQVDVDQNLNLATLYRVDTLPTFILFKNGEPVHRVVGLQSEVSVRRILGVTPLEVSEEVEEDEVTVSSQETDAIHKLLEDLHA